MIKVAFIGLFVFLLCAGNAGLSQLGQYAMTMTSSWDNQYSNAFAKTWPLDPAEEKSCKGEEEGKSFNDSYLLSFKWASQRLSNRSDDSQHEAVFLFESIDREILVPPPRA